MVITMKKISLILISAICCAMLFSCNSEPEARDITDADGNVVAVGYYNGDTLLYEEKSDSNGNLATKTSYDKDGNVEKVENYAVGFLAEEVEYDYDSEENYVEKSTVYNNKGDVVSITETNYEDGIAVSSTTTTPLANGESNVQESTFKYNEDGTVLEEITSDGKKIRETYTDGNGVVIYDHEFFDTGASAKTFYDAGEVITKVENFTAEGELLVTIVNTYDEEGTLIKTHTYDKDSNLKEYSEFVYANGTLLAVYKYNANGTIHTSVIYDEEGKAEIFEGQYVLID